MTPLEAELRRLIAADGPITVAHYMALCLNHPRHGYYATRDPLGACGDFVTAPEISQMFGELIGLWAVATWQGMGAPDPIRLVELGPGRGTLMADALRAARLVPAFGNAVRVHLVETSPVLRRFQEERLSGCGAVLAWHADIEDVPAGPLLAIANEFFDALPVHQAVKAADGWHERMVGVAGGRLVLALHPEPLHGLDAILPPRVRAAPLGAIYEWRSDLTVTALARRVVREGGVALIIDYGHVESAAGETLQGVRGHAFADPLDAPGETDLTAHVDFAALAQAARRAGAAVHGPLPQGEFLLRLGIAERAEALQAGTRGTQRSAIAAARERLTGGGPHGMGQMFKVLAIGDPRLARLPGFDS